MSSTSEWIKATKSNGGGDCVQMRRNGTAIEVRDSKHGEDGPVLSFTKKEFDAWLDGANNGEFSHLLSD
jgi:hypothetical protein